MQSSSKIDPIRFEIMRNAAQAMVEEMGVALARSAYSTNIKTRLDFSCALFDGQVRTIAQSASQPNHLGSLVFSVPLAIKDYGVERLQEGDGILINDAHKGMVHLNDISLISPLYYHGEVFGFAANIAHHVDVGGRAPGSLGVSTEIYQEGIIIPGVKILKSGEIDEDFHKLIMANVRGKKEFSGDLRAQVAANKLGQRRIGELIDRFGLDNVQAFISYLFDYTERRTRAAIAQWPKGQYEGETYVDDDGFTDKPIKIVSRVVVGPQDLVIDLSSSDGQTVGPMNSTYAQSFAGAVYPVKTLLPQDIPVNDGFYRVTKVIAPKGKVVNCEHPHAVVGGWEVALKTTEATFAAFSKMVPDRVAAEGKKTILHLAFGAKDPRSGEYKVFIETLAGGYGARPNKDGEDAVQAHHQNTENAPVEELEIGYPVTLIRYELRPDSEGAGMFRGGLGLRRDYRFTAKETVVTILADTVKFPPLGRFGGLPAMAASYLLNPDTPNRKKLSSKTTLTVTSDDIVSMQTPGGGGYGSPLERDPGLVLLDVKAKKISVDRAREVYGVVKDKTSLTVDGKATAKKRAEIKATKSGRR